MSSCSFTHQLATTLIQHVNFIFCGWLTRFISKFMLVHCMDGTLKKAAFDVQNCPEEILPALEGFILAHTQLTVYLPKCSWSYWLKVDWLFLVGFLLGLATLLFPTSPEALLILPAVCLLLEPLVFTYYYSPLCHMPLPVSVMSRTHTYDMLAAVFNIILSLL